MESGMAAITKQFSYEKSHLAWERKIAPSVTIMSQMKLTNLAMTRSAD
jgi:hypothetical protein